jgi:2-amino-4-hydroxy-6-hydroxymethyldihydropteridine diphosphokinase
LTKVSKGEIIYLSLGSNLGDRMQNLRQARELIERRAVDLPKVSKIYQSEAWGYSSSNDFYNCCLSAISHLEPLELLDSLMKIESSLGRVRKGGGYSDRLIDIDLLFYGDTILEQPRLTLPHPAMATRRFVLLPLTDIAAELVHPVSGLTIKEMLESCPETDGVIPVTTW